MDKGKKTLILLSPVFNVYEKENWLPWQTVFVRAINELYPSLNIVILSFHFPVATQKKHDWNGNDVYLFGETKKGKLHTARLWWRVWWQLKQLKKEHDVIGVFSFFCSECAFIGHHFAKRNNLLHKIWILGQDAKKENKQVRRIRPEADELVCVSDFLQREFYKNHGVQPALVVPIGVDPTFFTNNITSRDIDLLGAGSLIPLKQYDVFADVVKLINDKLSVVKAVICGDGVERQRLSAKIEALQLSANITLEGYKSHEEVLRLMQQSKILLHTSSYEGLGMVMLEALYAGAHVVSFIKPLDAVIDHWHIVQTKEEMAEKVLELLTNETDYTPVLAYNVCDAARQIVELFDAHSDAVS